MTYVKWVANANRHEDGTTRIIEEDGTIVEMGVPLQLSAERRKVLEAEGRIFEDSSKDEADELKQQQIKPTVGNDVVGSAPVFESKQASAEEGARERENDKRK